MRSLLFVSTMASAAFAVPQSTAASTPLERTFTTILQNQADAQVRGDDTHVADETAAGYFAVDEKGSVETRSDALAHRTTPEVRRLIQRGAAELHLTEHVEDVHVSLYRDTAVVRSKLVMSLVVNAAPVAKKFRVTSVFVRRAQRWLLASTQQTVIPLDPIPVQVDPSSYGDYVGAYRLTRSQTYKVTREANRLFLDNGAKHELVPESASTFVIKGNQYRVTFVRDSRGVVASLLVREFPGVQYSAIRVSSPAH